MTRLGKNKGPTICSPVGYFSFDRRHKVQGIKKKKKKKDVPCIQKEEEQNWSQVYLQPKKPGK